MQREQVESILSRFNGKRVLVIGDLMVDEYIWGHASRVSPEAPVPVLDILRETFVPGGAGNVATQMVAFGAEVVIAGAVGNDATGERLRDSLGKIGVDTSAIVSTYDRPTTQKTRIVAGSQQIVRVDREKRDPLPEFTARRLVSGALQRLGNCDALLFSDYDKGALTRETVRELIQAGQKQGMVITANPKPATARFYEGARVAQMNRLEADLAANLFSLVGKDALNGVTPFTSEEEPAFQETGMRLCQAMQIEHLLVTRSSEGATVFHFQGGYTDVPAFRVEVFDSTGAGDSTIAGLTLALTTGASLLDAVAIGNASGSVVVRKVGVVTATREEIASLFPSA